MVRLARFASGCTDNDVSFIFFGFVVVVKAAEKNIRLYVVIVLWTGFGVTLNFWGFCFIFPIKTSKFL